MIKYDVKNVNMGLQYDRKSIEIMYCDGDSLKIDMPR